MDGLTLSDSGIMTSNVPLEWIIAGVGDLDGDENADIIYRNTTTGDVAASLMNGLTVSESAIITSGVSLEWVIENVADLNGDGKADLVYRNMTMTTGDVAATLMDGLTVSELGFIAGSVPLAWEIQP